MVDLKIFSKDSTIKLMKNNLKLQEYGINIDLLMIWSLKLQNSKEAMFGPAKTMMVMFNLTLLLKVI
jgi:hypothetical protein